MADLAIYCLFALWGVLRVALFPNESIAERRERFESVSVIGCCCFYCHTTRLFRIHTLKMHFWLDESAVCACVDWYFDE